MYTNAYQGIKIAWNSPNAIDEISEILYNILKNYNLGDITFICIGTDRTTGDSLGPYVGSLLIRYDIPCKIIGTIDNPVHATNLNETLRILSKKTFVVAIDACLGQLESVGCIVISKGSLEPGSAFNKNLPHVGDCCIKGVVNVGGYREQEVLQSTRLKIVWDIGKVIVNSIIKAINYLQELEVAATLETEKSIKKDDR